MTFLFPIPLGVLVWIDSTTLGIKGGDWGRSPCMYEYALLRLRSQRNGVHLTRRIQSLRSQTHPQHTPLPKDRRAHPLTTRIVHFPPQLPLPFRGTESTKTLTYQDTAPPTDRVAQATATRLWTAAVNTPAVLDRKLKRLENNGKVSVACSRFGIKAQLFLLAILLSSFLLLLSLTGGILMCARSFSLTSIKM